MAFYLSPLVDVKEIDLSTTIPAVATSIGVIVLRHTRKGPEMKETFITSEDELLQVFGAPTKNSFKDWFAAAGYLKYGNKLYCTRVLELSATFSGLQYDGNVGTPWVIDGVEDDNKALTLADLGDPDNLDWGDPDEYDQEELVDGENLIEIIAASRGDWGNHIRISFLDYATQQTYFIPYSDPAATPELSAWYPYEWNSAGTALDIRATWSTDILSGALSASYVGDPALATYQTMYQTDVTLQNDKEFLCFVESRTDANDDWDLQETWYVSTEPGKLNDDGRVMYAETVVNNTSRYVRFNMNEVSTIDQAWIINTNLWDEFGGGQTWENQFPLSGEIDPVDSDNIGQQLHALDLYDNPEEIDVTIFIDGDKDETVKAHMIHICETRKDCMATIDCPYHTVVDNRHKETTALVDWRTERGYYGPYSPGIGFNQNTSYAAVYGNWIEIFDKYNNKYRWVPMSGHAAGIYAKTDDVADPWWAPAGLNRAILTNVRRLAWNPNLGHRDLLYKNGINPIVSFAGQGKVIWGQKTMLDKPSSFNRVNVRRLFIVLEKAISTAAKYFLFEPNDEITRLQLKNMIEPFLRDVQSRRGIYDFQVICDETNNTPERIDRNELWCTILIKATRVAEFIVLQFVSLKTGASFEESAKAVQ